ncbi:MAG: ABC transporter permease [Brooklawnia sp.]|jgi:ABC-2 type transport system permease protein
MRANHTRQPAWLTVAVREIMVKLTDKTFLIGTLTTVVLLGAGIAAGYFLGNRPSTTDLVVTSEPAAALAQAVDAVVKADNPDNAVNLTRVADEGAAHDLLADGQADAWLAQGSNGGWVLTWQSEPGGRFEAALSQVLTAQTITDLSARAGSTPGEVHQQMSFESKVLEGDAQGMMGYFVGLAFAVLFMMSSMLYGMQIAQSVIEEKQSRIIEILVSVIPVRALLAGKVVGNTLIAVGQMALLLGVGLLGVALTPISEALPNLGSAVGWFLVFFLAGFLALACIWAAAGALGTRNEDLQHTSQPLTWLLMVVYFAGFLATGQLRVVLSFVPIISSILMPVRIVDGTADWWEPFVALTLNLAFAAGMVLLGERIYRRALLQTQGRLSFKQALTAGLEPVA